MTKKKKTKRDVTPNPALKKFWTKPARIRVLYGGRSSSKSWDAASVVVIMARKHCIKVMCCRQFQNKIEESVYTLLKFQIYRYGFQAEYQILTNKIIHKYSGSEFIFYGLWRHIEEIKSTEGVHICWIEEAHNLIPSQWDILEPTLRVEGSQFWIIFNPQISTDFVYQRFVVNPPARTVIRKINYDENPYLSETIKQVIEAKKAEDYDEYLHIYEGVPRDDDESVIIKRAWLNAAIDAHIALGFEPEGSRRVGFDVADDGGDRCVNVFAHGSVAMDMYSWKANEDELLKSCKHTYENARTWQAKITYDATGVGASCGSKFAEINEETPDSYQVDYEKFQAGGAVTKPDKEYKDQVINKDMFSNLKAQTWWLVADRLRNTWDAITNGTHYPPDELISLSSSIPDIEKLITELSTPKKDYDGAGRVKVESKKDLLKREVNSPDMADAFVMAFAPPAIERGILDVLMARNSTGKTQARLRRF